MVLHLVSRYQEVKAIVADMSPGNATAQSPTLVCSARKWSQSNKRERCSPNHFDVSDEPKTESAQAFFTLHFSFKKYNTTDWQFSLKSQSHTYAFNFRIDSRFFVFLSESNYIFFADVCVCLHPHKAGQDWDCHHLKHR